MKTKADTLLASLKTQTTTVEMKVVKPRTAIPIHPVEFLIWFDELSARPIVHPISSYSTLLKKK